ncbi:hypothetical protein FB45DRAFT_733010 [Roridomyces roridus]|uniref:BTB domain-containing protein n=1 Tax=Roridomyces roridus TaxID=1738132 RepID=A0AAD7CG71_9AGAR|nr:hypothetical protein FB45DRAFT_733010 [Roridomyces roridus]
MDSYVESPLWTPVGFGRPAHAQEAWAWPAGEPYYSPVRHPRFWFEDGNLAIRVENTLYNLHRYLFAKSSTFSAYQYQLGGTRELKENKTDFDRLLSILYPTDYGSHQCKTTEEWTSVLLLANKWGMWDIRRLAISQLSICAGPVDKIALGHRYNVQEWLGPAYMELTMRGQAISAEEGAKLGVDAMVRLGALKDEVFGNLPAFVDEDKFSDLFAQKLYV